MKKEKNYEKKSKRWLIFFNILRVVSIVLPVYFILGMFAFYHLKEDAFYLSILYLCLFILLLTITTQLSLSEEKIKNYAEYLRKEDERESEEKELDKQLEKLGI